jgi:poly-gamma-glutamate synthesis protein (capsule biosynthesis protein)
MEQPVHSSLTLLAAGDNLLHDTLLASSLKNGVYDFSPIYAEVKPLVENADMAFINQETVMAGEQFGYSGYPQFNTPQVLATTLAETGFDIVNHANNHAMDMGEEGLLATIDLWAGFPDINCLGIQRSGEKQRLITKNNITLGFLAYTYDTNGIPLPKDKPWLVSLINRGTMAKEIDALRPLCDILIVSMHWGDEYIAEPSASQLSLAAFLAEHQVDLVIGHHPHVLQRFEILPRPGGKKMFCFYSLGNFVSHQRQKERILGAFMYVEFIKEGDKVFIADSGLIPVISHFDQNLENTRIIPLYAYNDTLLEKHWIRLVDENLTMKYFYSSINKLQAKVIMRSPFSFE